MQSPLIDIIMNYAADTAGFALNSEKDQTIREIFQKYINHLIDENELMSQSINICNSSAPAEKLAAIVMTEKEKPLEPPPIHNKLAIQSRRQTRSWSTNEDNRLLMAIHKYGNDNWNKIALYVGNGRSRSQCSQRWIRVLDPKISKNHWTEEEEAMLIDLVKKFGNKNWMKISVCMGNRSDVQCRYRYKHLLQKQPNSFDEENLSESSSLGVSPNSSLPQVLTQEQSNLVSEIKSPSAQNLSNSNLPSENSDSKSLSQNISSSQVNSIQFNMNDPFKSLLDANKNQIEAKKDEKIPENSNDNIMLNSFFKDLFNGNEVDMLKDEQYDDLYSCFI